MSNEDVKVIKKAEEAKRSESTITKVNIGSLSQMLSFSNTLKRIIWNKKLYTKLDLYNKKTGKTETKYHINVEAWQFAGAAMGIFPVIKSVKNLSTEGEIKFRARVELIEFKTGKIIGMGIGLCSNKEAKKTTFEEYAVSSMSQTRAVARAYRNTIAWMIKVADKEFDTTPAEELPATNGQRSDSTPDIKDLDSVVGQYEKKIAGANNPVELKSVSRKIRGGYENNIINDKTNDKLMWKVEEKSDSFEKEAK